jgi:FtsP/CotA-like multicopper oxidase with cupredoxin domain
MVIMVFKVVVNVVNELLEESLTIHWHGIHMKNNPWMDGTAYVTQCPVRPKVNYSKKNAVPVPLGR